MWFPWLALDELGWWLIHSAQQMAESKSKLETAPKYNDG